MDNLSVYYLLSAMNSVSSNNKCTCSCNTNNSQTNSFDLVFNELLKKDDTINTLFNVIDKNSISLDTIYETLSNLSTTPDMYASSGISKCSINPTNKDSLINERIKSAVSNASKKYGLDEDLIMSVIKVESDFNPNCASKAGAKGLMQLMPVNEKDYNVQDVFNIEENIDAGTHQLKDYINMFNGKVEMGLMAYNAGQGTMQKRGVTSLEDLYKMPKETQNYVPKVMSLYKGV